jgi:hypothetical protein
MSARPVLTALAIGSALLGAPAMAQVAGSKPPAHHAARAKETSAASPFAAAGTMRADDWYSFGPPREAEIEREAPGVQLKVHDPQAESIIVYGARRHRDFEGTAPIPNLTSPQALDAAQPVVPGIGDSCSYKYGCFDSSQTPLRDSIGNLLGIN